MSEAIGVRTTVSPTQIRPAASLPLNDWLSIADPTCRFSALKRLAVDRRSDLLLVGGQVAL
jgi:hypothetical protein